MCVRLTDKPLDRDTVAVALGCNPKARAAAALTRLRSSWTALVCGLAVEPIPFEPFDEMPFSLKVGVTVGVCVAIELDMLRADKRADVLGEAENPATGVDRDPDAAVGTFAIEFTETGSFSVFAP